MPYDQSKRLLKITTKLGPDLVMLTELDGVDELSRPFLFKIRIVTDQPLDKVKDLLGTEVTLEFGHHAVPEAMRPLRGHVRRLVRTARSNAAGTEWEWEAEVVPKLWFMSLRTNMRIFSEKTLKDIIDTIAFEHGIHDRTIRATSFEEKFDFCVQYRESDLDFLSRLMERHGWFYFHRHEATKTSLVIGDDNLQGEYLDTIDPSTGVRIKGPVNLDGFDVAPLTEDFSVRSGQWAYTEFNVDAFLAKRETRPRKVGGDALKPEHERYDYVGAFRQRSLESGRIDLMAVGRKLTDIAMEREEALHHLRRGTSANPFLDAGRQVRLGNGPALVTAVTHRARDYSHWSAADWGDQEPTAPFYVNDVTCIPKDVPFRPQAITPRPIVDGPQTAKVVQGGENPEVDPHGRVKLRFHWDREERASTWVRVSQGWASHGYGQMHLPRAGDEVIVEFLEGDPDRPIVTGHVYNGKNKVPFGVGDTHMQSGIRTSTNNQLRFDDKNGKEEVYIRAQRALLAEVVDTATIKIGEGTGQGNRVTEIKNDDKLTLQQGNLTIKASAGSIEIEASKQLVLKVGANKITISQDGVKVEGTMVDVKGQASANFEASGTTSVKGAMIMIG